MDAQKFLGMWRKKWIDTAQSVGADPNSMAREGSPEQSIKPVSAIAPYTAKPGTPEYTAMQAKFMADEQTSQGSTTTHQPASQDSNSPSAASNSEVETAPARSIKKEEALPPEETKAEIITEDKGRRSRSFIQAAISSAPPPQESKTAITQGVPEYKLPPEPKSIQPEPPPSIEKLMAAAAQQQSQTAQQVSHNSNRDKGPAAALPHIPTEFDDVTLTLMAYDRI